jgi:hypothetical protein
MRFSVGFFVACVFQLVSSSHAFFSWFLRRMRFSVGFFVACVFRLVFVATVPSPQEQRRTERALLGVAADKLPP